ncbi:MAG: bifunctional YncE family protein/alkaline phosphatase family protein [Candidatus Lernaella stagnicola]|nr:bifunctional YncE family protein/alkaline phosphatase family protein [Candidatus Lernaella stagnicola]
MNALLRHKIWIVMLLALFLFACDTGDNPEHNDPYTASEATLDDDDDDAVAPTPTPSAEAYERAGPRGDGTIILPNGRLLSPVGERVTVKRFPMSIVAHPTADRLYVATTRTPALFVIDTATFTVLSEVALPHHFGGMVISDAGTTLWVCDGRGELVREFTIAGDSLVETRQFDAYGYPTDVRLSADEQTMYVSLAYGKRIKVIDVASGLEIGSMNTGYYPYAVAIAESINRAVSSNWGTSTVSVFRLDDGELLADVEVGKNPEGMVLAPDGRSVFVACADSDEIHRVDLVDLVVTQEIPLDPSGDLGYGAMPTEVALSPDGEMLLVVSTGYNSIDVFDVADGEMLGRIPTEWYPTMVLPMDDMLYVLSGKGIGSGPGNVSDPPPDPLPPEGGRLLGSVEAIDMPGEETLAEYTEMVVANNSRTSLFYESGVEFDSPIPSRRNEPSEQIKHVVFILKENKTFDQVLSDLPGVEGDDSLLLFGENITPNLHALATEFTVFDNYYSESHESDMGHSWATQVVANDYVEKNWVAGNWFTVTGVEPATIPESGTVFNKMLDAELDFRVYGEMVGILTEEIDRLAAYVDFNYGFYNQAVSDRRKAREVIREWDMGVFPPFIYILVPNDHTYGTSTGEPTMDYMVADNDAGVGLLVDWIVKSEHWPETAIFITQDDPQSGVDHIDAHRTPFVIVSPYAKRGHISSVHYSMASMWLTFELILGLPPMTNYDRFTAPMFDAFQSEPVLDTTFAAIPSNVPYAENPADLPFADYCARQNWDVPDQVERIGEVVWAYMKPGVPFPHYLSVAPSEREGEDEEKERAHYRHMVQAYREYAIRHGLLDPALSLLGKQGHQR